MKMYRIFLGWLWKYHVQKRVTLFGRTIFWYNVYKTDILEFAKKRLNEYETFPIYGDSE